MKKNIYLAIIGIVLILIIVGYGMRAKQGVSVEQKSAPSQNTVTTPLLPAQEFTMKSFVEFVDGKPKPQFSLNKITVKKGELVRLKVTDTKGMHNINIDEFNIHVETPLNEEKIIEFTPDRTGDFIYYCSKPGHRQAGHWGTLTVTE